jgi:lipoate-protein ligase A
MAVDEAILEAVGRGEVLPTLRLYAWDPPCLSLGIFQLFSDIDAPALHRLGWEIVRRPTGGRAILHTDELTYAVIAPLHEPRVAGSVLESYSRLSQALLLALNLLGLPAEAAAKPPALADTQAGGAVCFEVPSNYEITVQGKKLIGSAQARRRDGVLQHGSLPLSGDLTRITHVLAYANEVERASAAERLLDHAATTAMLDRALTWQECAEAFTRAFSQALNIHFLPEPLTESELLRAEALVAAKYGSPAWTERL